MKTLVDMDICIGCGLCAQMAPEIYEMYDGKAYIRVDNVPCAKEEKTRKAYDECPVDAISIQEK